MKNKHANLMIEVTKDLVCQYYEQLEESIRQNEKNINFNELDAEYRYEFCVNRAKIFSKFLKNIIDNFDESIFDGELFENKILFATYNNGKKEYITILNYSNATRDSLEQEITSEGIDRVLRNLCIEKNTLGTAIYFALKKVDGTVELEKDEDEEFKLVPSELIFSNSGLVINDSLESGMTNNQQILGRCASEIRGFSQGVKFVVDANRTALIIDDYLKNELYNTDLDDVRTVCEVKDSLIYDTFSALVHMIGNNSNLYGATDNISKLRNELRYRTRYMKVKEQRGCEC